MKTSPAQQIFAREFDSDYFLLSKNLQELIQRKIDQMGAHLATFPHTRLQGAAGNYRLRVGDYRVIYAFDLARNVVFLKLVGHRREVCR